MLLLFFFRSFVRFAATCSGGIFVCIWHFAIHICFTQDTVSSFNKLTAMLQVFDLEFSMVDSSSAPKKTWNIPHLQRIQIQIQIQNPKRCMRNRFAHTFDENISFDDFVNGICFGYSDMNFHQSIVILRRIHTSSMFWALGMAGVVVVFLVEPHTHTHTARLHNTVSKKFGDAHVTSEGIIFAKCLELSSAKYGDWFFFFVRQFTTTIVQCTCFTNGTRIHSFWEREIQRRINMLNDCTMLEPFDNLIQLNGVSFGSFDSSVWWFHHEFSVSLFVCSLLVFFFVVCLCIALSLLRKIKANKWNQSKMKMKSYERKKIK